MEDVVIAAVGAIRSPDGDAVRGLGESLDGVGRHILVSRSLDVDGAAIQGELYAVSNEYGATVEGGIVDFELQGRFVSLVLSSEAAKTLGYPAALRLEISDSAEAEHIGRALAWLVHPALAISDADFADAVS